MTCWYFQRDRSSQIDGDAYNPVPRGGGPISRRLYFRSQRFVGVANVSTRRRDGHYVDMPRHQIRGAISSVISSSR